MLRDILELALSYVQYLMLIVAIAPYYFPSFYQSPTDFLRYVNLDFQAVTNVFSEGSREHNFLDVEIPDRIPLDVRLWFLGISVILPLLLNLVGIVALAGKKFIVWFTLLSVGVLSFTTGICYVAGSEGQWLEAAIPDVWGNFLVYVGAGIIVLSFAILGCAMWYLRAEDRKIRRIRSLNDLKRLNNNNNTNKGGEGGGSISGAAPGASRKGSHTSVDGGAVLRRGSSIFGPSLAQIATGGGSAVVASADGSPVAAGRSTAAAAADTTSANNREPSMSSPVIRQQRLAGAEVRGVGGGGAAPTVRSGFGFAVAGGNPTGNASNFVGGPRQRATAVVSLPPPADDYSSASDTNARGGGVVRGGWFDTNTTQQQQQQQQQGSPLGGTATSVSSVSTIYAGAGGGGGVTRTPSFFASGGLSPPTAIVGGSGSGASPLLGGATAAGGGGGGGRLAGVAASLMQTVGDTRRHSSVFAPETLDKVIKDGLLEEALEKNNKRRLRGEFFSYSSSSSSSSDGGEEGDASDGAEEDPYGGGGNVRVLSDDDPTSEQEMTAVGDPSSKRGRSSNRKRTGNKKGRSGSVASNASNGSFPPMGGGGDGSPSSPTNSTSNTTVIKDTNQGHLSKAAAKASYDLIMNQQVEHVDVRETITRLVYGLVLVFVGLYLTRVISINNSIESLAALAREVLFGVGLVLFMFAGVAFAWFALGLFYRGRVWQFKIGGFIRDHLVSALLLVISVLYIPAVTNVILVLNCRTIECNVNTRLRDARSSFMYPEGSSEAVCEPCLVSTTPQTCPSSYADSLCLPVFGNRLREDSSVSCEDVQQYFWPAAGIIFVCFAVSVPFLNYLLTRASTEHINSEFPVDLRQVEGYTEEEVYREKVDLTDNVAKFIYDPFQKRYKQWRLLFIFQKLSIVVVSVFSFNVEPFMGSEAFGIALSLFIHGTCFLLHLFVRPFNRKVENIFVIVTQLFLTVACAVGLCNAQGATVPDTAGAILAILSYVVPTLSLAVGAMLTFRDEIALELRRDDVSRRVRHNIKAVEVDGGGVGPEGKPFDLLAEVGGVASDYLLQQHGEEGMGVDKILGGDTVYTDTKAIGLLANKDRGFVIERLSVEAKATLAGGYGPLARFQAQLVAKNGGGGVSGPAMMGVLMVAPPQLVVSSVSPTSPSLNVGGGHHHQPQPLQSPTAAAVGVVVSPQNRGAFVTAEANTVLLQSSVVGTAAAINSRFYTYGGALTPPAPPPLPPLPAALPPPTTFMNSGNGLGPSANAALAAAMSTPVKVDKAMGTGGGGSSAGAPLIAFGSPMSPFQQQQQQQQTSFNVLNPSASINMSGRNATNNTAAAAAVLDASPAGNPYNSTIPHASSLSAAAVVDGGGGGITSPPPKTAHDAAMGGSGGGVGGAAGGGGGGAFVPPVLAPASVTNVASFGASLSTSASTATRAAVGGGGGGTSSGWGNGLLQNLKARQQQQPAASTPSSALLQLVLPSSSTNNASVNTTGTSITSARPPMSLKQRLRAREHWKVARRLVLDRLRAARRQGILIAKGLLSPADGGDAYFLMDGAAGAFGPAVGGGIVAERIAAAAAAASQQHHNPRSNANHQLIVAGGGSSSNANNNAPSPPAPLLAVSSSNNNNSGRNNHHNNNSSSTATTNSAHHHSPHLNAMQTWDEFLVELLSAERRRRQRRMQLLKERQTAVRQRSVTGGGATDTNSTNPNGRATTMNNNHRKAAAANNTNNSLRASSIAPQFIEEDIDDDGDDDLYGGEASRKRAQMQLRTQLKRMYERHLMKLVSLQRGVDFKINTSTISTLIIFFVFCGVCSLVACNVSVIGVMSSDEGDAFIGGTRQTVDDSATYQLLNFSSWEAFTAHCCCLPFSQLEPQWPYYVAQGEKWVCSARNDEPGNDGRVEALWESGVSHSSNSNGGGGGGGYATTPTTTKILTTVVIKERFRVISSDGTRSSPTSAAEESNLDDPSNGLAIRSLCGMTFSNNCSLVVDPLTRVVSVVGCNTNVSSASLGLF